MKFAEGFRKVILKVSQILSYVSHVALIFMVLITVADVVLRLVANSPIVGSYELVQYTLLVYVFASFAMCQMMRGHIQVTVLIRKLSQKAKLVIYTITGLFSTAVMFFVAYAAAEQAKYATRKGLFTDVLGMPTAPFMWFEFACMIIFSIACLLEVVQSVVALFNDDLRIKLFEEWD